MAAADWVVLRDVLRERAETQPEQVAFVHGDEHLTYADLAERATARAAGLQRRGVTAGERIAVAMSPGLAFIEVFWALQVLGAVPCAFNPAVPAQTLSRRMQRIRPHLVVSDELADDLLAGSGSIASADIGPDDLAFLQLTSGTSGAPRASMIRHRNAFAYLQGCWTDGHFDPDEIFVSWAPPWHDLGLVRFVIGTVHDGFTCHLVDPAISTIPRWLSTISRVGGTYSAAPDFAFRLATRMVDPATVDLSSLRSLTSGGEPVRLSSIQAFETRFAVPGVVTPGYGLGESTLAVSTQRRGEGLAVDERGNVSCGRPMSSLQVTAGESPDSPEEVLVRGDTVFAGYFDAPEETATKLRDGWLHTGDAGYLDDQGRLFVLGRRTGMIKRAGGVVAPRELEEAAQRAGGVRVAGATSIRDPDREDETIIVAVEADVSAQRPAEQVAAEVSREIVAALGFAPGRVSVVPPRTLPLTENGKVRHDKLRGILRGQAESA